MSKLGSLYALSDELISSAALQSPVSAPTAGPEAQIKSSSTEQASRAAREETSEADQGMTCLTCGIGRLIHTPFPRTEYIALLALASRWLQQGHAHAGTSQPLFASHDEQRAHFRSDWHRRNIRRKVHGRIALTEDDFERSLRDDGQASSISASESDSDSDDTPVAAMHRTPEVHFVSGMLAGQQPTCMLPNKDPSCTF